MIFCHTNVRVSQLVYNPWSLDYCTLRQILLAEGPQGFYLYGPQMEFFVFHLVMLNLRMSLLSNDSLVSCINKSVFTHISQLNLKFAQKINLSWPYLSTGLQKIIFQNPWDTFLGDCSVIDKYLIDKPLAGKWFIAHFLNVLLRSVGQVTKFKFIAKYMSSISWLLQLAFVNNPIGGLLVVGVLFARQWEIAVGTLLGGAVATIAEMVIMAKGKCRFAYCHFAYWQFAYNGSPNTT